MGVVHHTVSPESQGPEESHMDQSADWVEGHTDSHMAADVESSEAAVALAVAALAWGAVLAGLEWSAEHLPAFAVEAQLDLEGSQKTRDDVGSEEDEVLVSVEKIVHGLVLDIFR